MARSYADLAPGLGAEAALDAPRYLSSGDLLVSDIAGLGELRQTFTR